MGKKENRTDLEKIRLNLIKQTLDKIRNNKKLIFIPNITENMQSSGHKWWVNHKCFNDIVNWVDDLDITQIPKPIIRIIHNSMASNIYLDCPRCNETHDATDYDSW